MTVQPLRLDFVRYPGPSLPGVLLLLSGIAVTLLFAWQYELANVMQEKALRELEKAREVTVSQLPVATSQPAEQTEAEKRRVHDIELMLARPWNSLFVSLEKSSMDDVALLAVQPDAATGQLRITAEAKDFDTIPAYLQRLAASGNLRDIHLIKNEEREGERDHAVRFMVGAVWRSS